MVITEVPSRDPHARLPPLAHKNNELCGFKGWFNGQNFEEILDFLIVVYVRKILRSFFAELLPYLHLNTETVF